MQRHTGRFATAATAEGLGKHLLTPRMAGLLERIHRARRTPLRAMTPEQARAAQAAGAEVLDLPRAPLARVEPLTLPCGDGQSRPARLHAPSRDRLPVLLFLHGGGFVVGGLETHDSLCRQLALRGGCAVVALDYRLAPEHPFPAAIDDTWAALRSLPERAPSEHDPLVDEGLAYADRLRLAGVPVTLEFARGVTHDFVKMGRALPEAGQAPDAAAHALRLAFRLE